MPSTKANEADWKVLLGKLIIAKQKTDELDPESVEPYTIPRVKASEDDIEALEEHIGERFDEHYRNFLMHANGWPKIYFNVGLFGIPELDGRGDWSIANELLAIYNDEGILEASGLEATGVMPIGAGQGMRHLIVIVRAGWPGAGQVVWIDGEELDRANNFTEFFTTLISDQEEHVEELEGNET